MNGSLDEPGAEQSGREQLGWWKIYEFKKQIPVEKRQL
jgi:hypothetical protein